MSNLFLSGFFIMLLLSGCGFDGTPTRHNDFTPLTSIEITAVPQTIAALTSTKLTATGNFSGLFTRDITDQVVWSSASPNVAEFITAANPNRVTGHIPGTAILTATVGSVTATFKLTVSDATITALTITPATPSVPKGLPSQFTASGTFSDSTTQDLTFDAVWASDAPTVATVSNDPASKGLAQALAIGTATISATFGSVSGSTPLTVTVPVLQSITVTPANPSILSLSSGNFQATGNYSDKSTKDITALAAWSSSRPDFATIASGGAATTLAQGPTTISATMDGVSGTTNLKVTGGNLIGFLLPNTGISLVEGSVFRMTATGTFTNNITRDITGSVVWSAANPALAEVTPSGGNLAFLNAKAVTPLTPLITVTATVGGKSIPATVTVNAPVPSSLLIAVPSTILPGGLTAGTTARFTATASFNDGSTQDVTSSATWTSTGA